MFKRFVRTMRGIQGALLVASVLPMLLGFLGIWRIVVRWVLEHEVRYLFVEYLITRSNYCKCAGS